MSADSRAPELAAGRPHDAAAVATFTEIITRLPDLLAQLWAAPALPRSRHLRIPACPGIYLFTENGKPMYVGQTRKLSQRLGYHTRPGAPQEQASFAFLLAKAEAKRHGITAVGTRRQVAEHPEVLPLFEMAKKRVAAMDVRFIEIPDPHVRTVFEVYAALALGTGEFNSFETH